MSQSSRPRLRPTEAQQMINPAAVLIGLTLAMGTRSSHRRIPPAAMSVGLTLAMAPVIPLANRSLQKLPHLMRLPLVHVQRGRRSLIALAKKLPRYIANELVTMLPNLALWLVSSVIAASVLPATSFMLGILAVSGPRVTSMVHPVRPIYHGFGSVWAPAACLAVTALGDSWRLPLRRNLRAWYLRKTGRRARDVPVTMVRSHTALDKARRAASFSLVTRVGLYYGLRKLASVAWVPSRILLRRALTLHPAVPFSPDYWQMLEAFLALQYQLTALMQCFWYTMSVCARFALPALGEHWGLLEAKLLSPHQAELIDDGVDEELEDSDYFEASEGEGAEHFITIVEAGSSRSAQVPPPVDSSLAMASPSNQRGAIVHAASIRTQVASTKKPRRPASSRVELSASQRVALAAQRSAIEAAKASMSTSRKTYPTTVSSAGSSRVGLGALATDGQASDVALGKMPERYLSPPNEAQIRHTEVGYRLPRRQGSPNSKPQQRDTKGKQRETLPQEEADREQVQSEPSRPGQSGGQDETGSYCVIEESTLSLPLRGTQPAASRPSLETEAETHAEREAEITSTGGEPSQGGLTRVSSSSSLLSSSSSSANAAPAGSTSRRDRQDSSWTRTAPPPQSSQVRQIDSFMDLNLEYATLRGLPRDSNAAQQPAASAAASGSTSGSAAAADGDGDSGSYDWGKRRYLQGARGSLGRPPQW